MRITSITLGIVFINIFDKHIINLDVQNIRKTLLNISNFRCL